MTLRNDPQEIRAALHAILEPGHVTELRALDATTAGDRRSHTEYGYFNDVEKLVEAVAEIRWAKGIYIIPNRVNPSLLARASNRLRAAAKGDPQTADGDIQRRLWLLIDCDPVRPAGISSTDVEHEAALARAREISCALKAAGWPGPIVADSSNGSHLMYRIDLPVEDRGLVERCLGALAARFDDGAVKIDKTVHNPSRIWKLYGTVSCKGDDTPDRPHRLSRIIHKPEQVVPVQTSLLEALAATCPAPARRPAPKPTQRNRFDLEQWIQGHGLDVTGPDPWTDKDGQAGRRWVFNTCPWNSDHTNRSAFIVQFADGKIGAGCHHNGCAAHDWHALRDLVEPGWRERRPRSSVDPSGSFDGSSPPHFQEPWRDPKPLPAELAPVLPFDPNLLPAGLRPWIQDIADRMQCPIDFPAIAAMVAVGSVVGRRVGIRPKRQDDWTVVANLWGLIIGRPGIMKTPALQEPTKPLTRLEIKAKEDHAEALKEWEAEQIVKRVTKKDTEKEIANTAKTDPAEALALAKQSIEEDDPPPPRGRYLVNDSTVEKLGETLRDNPNGTLIYRDELSGFLRNLDREGQEGARAFYLEAWNGTGRFTYDRIGRGTVKIESAIVSVIGSIQPGPLAAYLREALRRGAGDDGLMQRFQLAVWPDVQREWVNVDRWPDTGAKKQANEVFDRLDALTAEAVASDGDPDDSTGIPFLRFAPDAQDEFDRWRAALEPRLRSGEEHPAIESHLAKYRSLIPSLALLIHLVDGGVGPVGLGALRRAIRWGVYLESHARRIYSVGINRDAIAARELARKIVGGHVKDGFALRDVYRHGWSGLDGRDDVVAAVAVLVDAGWLRETVEPTEGAPRTRYWVNPKILEGPPEPPDKTDKSGPGTPLSVLSPTVGPVVEDRRPTEPGSDGERGDVVPEGWSREQWDAVCRLGDETDRDDPEGKVVWEK